MKKLLTTIGTLAFISMQAGYAGNNERMLLQREAARENTAVAVRNISEPSVTTDVALSGSDENDYAVYVPNTFTPNNDGLNDTFRLFGTGITAVKMEIYNREGTKLFESVNSSSGWDGCHNGSPCAVATYVYLLELRADNGIVQKKIGHVNLIR